MDMFQNSDFFFVVESFKIFFEKVLTVVSDPKGIAIQEWMKYKDKLTAKEATPSSIYCYAHQLVISTQQEGGNIVKLKRQSSRRGSKKVNTPRKITRRNSFGSKSPSAKNKEEQTTQDTDNFTAQVNSQNHAINPSNFSAGVAATKSNQGNNGINYGSEELYQVNQQSPWIDNDRKKNPSPAKRINTNEIQQMKGLDELSKMKNTKVNEQFQITKQLLLEKVKKCVEQFQKDSTSLDLINERSFQTQTMLVDNKRKPFDRSIKRQDSKFIREFSIYKKNNPGVGQPATAPGSREPTSQYAKEFLKEQQEQFITQQQKQQTITNNNTNNNNNLNNNTTNNTGSTGITSGLPTSANNVLLGLQIDFIKSKNTTNPGQPDYLAGVGLGGQTNTTGIPSSTGTIGTGLTSTTPNYLNLSPSKPNSYQTPPIYIPQHKSTHSAGTGALLGTNIGTTTTTTTANTTTTGGTGGLSEDKKGIDDIVQRILKEQKVKEEQEKLNLKKYEQDKMVQDILNKHKIQNQTSPSYPSSGTSAATATGYTGSSGSGAINYNFTPSSLTTSSNNTSSPYLNQSPIKGLGVGINLPSSLSNPLTQAYTTNTNNYGLSSLPPSNQK